MRHYPKSCFLANLVTLLQSSLMNLAVNVFLAAHDWPADGLAPFPADWSARRYARLRREAAPQRAILMQTAPDDDFYNFMRIAEFLRAVDASAPEIYGFDAEHGLMLLEDFGDRNFGRMIDAGAEAMPLLLRAVDALVEVQRRFIAYEKKSTNKSGVIPAQAGIQTFTRGSAEKNKTLDTGLRRYDKIRYDAQRFIDLLAPVLENFSYPDPGAARQSLHEVWSALLEPLESQPQSLLLRDFIADNLMDLPERQGWQSVGFLDFELAGIGPIAYDPASLLEQVRRDLPETACEAVTGRFLTAWPELDPATFRDSLDIMAAHRHLRIFARLHKMQRPEFLQRTHAYLRHCLARPALHPAQGWLETYLPQYFT